MDKLPVSNAGPLMVLSKLNVLHLLKQLYGEVLIPQVVYQETVINGTRLGFTDAYTLKLFLTQTHWKILDLAEIPQSILSTHLDQGEKQAIAWALSKNALLLMDEEAGRVVARKYGLKVKGSLGVLIQAYRNEFISFEQLQLYFKQISNRKDIWISSQLCQRLLERLQQNNLQP